MTLLRITKLLHLSSLSRNVEYSRKLCQSVTSLPPAKKDKYGGLTLDIGELSESRLCALSAEEFDKQLKDWLQQWYKAEVKATWLRIPIYQGSHISVAAKHGFKFHHAEGDSCLLCLWMQHDRKSALPRFATHQVGSAGCVVREDTGEVLVVKDRHNPFALWKFPGGLSDLNEDLCDTAVREVLEETGINTDFKGVMLFRQQHQPPGAFGRSDLFFLSLLNPLTFDINLDPNEITACEWMNLDELEKNVNKSGITALGISLLRHGLRHGFESVILNTQEMKSLYKGQLFKVYHPRIENLEFDSDYQHHLADASLLLDVKQVEKSTQS